MATKHVVGTIMKYQHRKSAVLETGLTLDGEEAVRIARIDPTRPKPADRARAVEVETSVGVYWVRLDHVSVVRAADVVHTWTITGKLNRAQLNAVRKELDKVSR
ncbi:hypothetical protein ADK67_29710 [Saccharothrix sp. NRRL B-16348]|jgi:hypothetical protein|uniref:hypothetical protein n=1 Tax=Saccharothrix sp. NRRL B-16348 TaxID=1415542 RepID=UPI0006B06309|nr:hypothetical protein [Saccharothrix sp. NRRL B-16348]KOX20474.1 hypothetical protein ADK67_29710 [Saccharothrix sp. NRRL B-16348]